MKQVSGTKYKFVLLTGFWDKHFPLKGTETAHASKYLKGLMALPLHSKQKYMCTDLYKMP